MAVTVLIPELKAYFFSTQVADIKTVVGCIRRNEWLEFLLVKLITKEAIA